ncbi:unnamed protein product [Caretta caretta]
MVLYRICPFVRKHLRAKPLEEKDVLLLDNCPAHPLAERLRTRDDKVRVEYLPKNMTCKIQPLDQGVIAIFKQHYRRNLVRKMIESELSVTDFLKKLTIKDFFYIGSDSWNLLHAETINCCWMVGLRVIWSPAPGFTEEEVGRTDLEWKQELCQQLFRLRVTALPQNIKSWIRGDDEAEEFCPVAESLIDDQILQAVRLNNIPEAEELAFAVEEEEEDEMDVVPTSTVTVAGSETALR